MEAFKLQHDWAHVRALVLRRDHGVCRACGLDCRRVARLLARARRDSYAEYAALRDDLAERLGVHLVAGAGSDLWQADHIVPRALGGTHDLDNLQTLCVGCHKRKTARDLELWRARGGRDGAA